MRRKINVFKYHDREFRCGDLSVWVYMWMLEDMGEALDYVLREYNEEVPELNDRQMKRFVNILLKWEDVWLDEDIREMLWDDRKSVKKKWEKVEDSDFHILVGKFMNCCPMWWSELENVPLYIFHKMLKDMGIILGKEKYDKNRNSNVPDKKKFKRLFGDLYN